MFANAQSVMPRMEILEAVMHWSQAIVQNASVRTDMGWPITAMVFCTSKQEK